VGSIRSNLSCRCSSRSAGEAPMSEEDSVQFE
jgi:hypothetical protein